METRFSRPLIKIDDWLFLYTFLSYINIYFINILSVCLMTVRIYIKYLCRVNKVFMKSFSFLRSLFPFVHIWYFVYCIISFFLGLSVFFQTLRYGCCHSCLMLLMNIWQFVHAVLGFPEPKWNPTFVLLIKGRPIRRRGHRHTH